MSKAKKTQRPVYPSQEDWAKHADGCQYHEELLGPRRGEWHCVPECSEKAKATQEEAP